MLPRNTIRQVELTAVANARVSGVTSAEWTLTVIDLSYSSDVQQMVNDTRSFTRETVLPIEDAHGGDIVRAGGDDLRVELQSAARAAGIFAPHAPVEFGGGGLNMSDRAPVFEEAGYSLFGPLATNISAPDEGKVH